MAFQFRGGGWGISHSGLDQKNPRGWGSPFIISGIFPGDGKFLKNWRFLSRGFGIFIILGFLSRGIEDFYPGDRGFSKSGDF